MKSQKREKRDVPEILPPEPKFIEKVYDKTALITEEDLKNLEIFDYIFYQKINSDYAYEINFPKDSKLRKVRKCSLRFRPPKNFQRFRFSFPKNPFQNDIIISESHLYSIKFPPSLTVIEKEAFKGHIFLDQITFLKNDNNENFLQQIDDKAFQNTIIESIIIPKNIKKIGSNCFPKTLNSIEFEDGTPNLKTIGKNTFENTQIETFIVPSNTEPFINTRNVFFRCKKLKNIVFDRYPNTYNDDDDGYIDKNDIKEKEGNNNDTQVHSDSDFLFLFENDQNKEEETENNQKDQAEEENSNQALSNNNDASNGENVGLPEFLLESDQNKEENNNQDLSDNNNVSNGENIGLPAFLLESDQNKEEENRQTFSDNNSNNVSNDEKINASSENGLNKEDETNNQLLSNDDEILNALFGPSNLEVENNHQNISDNIYSNQAFLDRNSDISIGETSNQSHNSFDIDRRSNDDNFHCSSNFDIPLQPFNNENNDSVSLNSNKSNDNQSTASFHFESPFNENKEKDTSSSSSSNQSIQSNDSNPTRWWSFYNLVENLKYHCLRKAIKHIRKYRRSLYDEINKYNDNNSCNRNDLEDNATSYLLSQTKIEKLEFLNTNINLFYFYNTPNLVNITIPDNEQSSYIKENGCIYTFDYCKLIAAERNIESITINSSCKIITNYALNIEQLKSVSFESDSQLLEISFCAFSESQISQIEIPSEVNKIGYASFFKCKKLEKVNLPSSLTRLDYVTFAFTNLRSILIPTSVKKIEYGCFYKCYNLKEVNFQECSNLELIDDFAFAFTGIEKISIPSSVTKIGNYCFLNCHNLHSIDFGNHYYINSCFSIIGLDCFAGTQIHSINLEKSNAYNDDFDFNTDQQNKCYYYHSNNQVFTIPFDTIFFYPNMFDDWKTISDIEINDFYPEGIMKFAFYNYKSLKHINNLDNVKFFGTSCFKNCISLELKSFKNEDYIYIDQSAFENSGIKDFSLESKKVVIMESAFKDCKKLQTFSIEADACFLGESSFVNCLSMKTFNISQTIDKIEINESCFMNSSINSFIIPNNLDNIPLFCFKNCKELQKVEISESSKIKTFSKEAFYGSGIEEIFIPKKTEHIYRSCFENCKKLNKVTFAKKYKNLTIHKKAFSQSSVTEIYFTKNINKIGQNSFEKCHKLTEITFSKTINKINQSAFIDCINLRNVTFKSKDVKICLFAFAGCNQLQTVTCKEKIKLDVLGPQRAISLNIIEVEINQKEVDKIMIDAFLINKESVFVDAEPLFPSNIDVSSPLLIKEKWHFNTQINLSGNYHLYVYDKGCYYSMLKDHLILIDKSIESYTIPKTIKFIKNDVLLFSNLKKIDFEIGSNVQKIKKGMFNNTKIEEISIPNTVTTICDYAFENCFYLKKVKIDSKSKLKKIGKNNFANTKIETILLPPELTQIDEYAFYNCLLLKSIDIYSTVLEFGVRSFNKCLKLKHLKFLNKPQKLTFNECSFEMTDIEKIKLNCDFDIKEGAFAFCPSLKKVSLKGSKMNCTKESFANSNIKVFKFEKKVDLIEDITFKSFDYLDLINSSIEKCSIMNIYYDKKSDITLNNEFLLENKCYIQNQKLIYADLINNKILTDESSSKIKPNEVLNVPEQVKSLNFQPMRHIKKIIWPSPCNVQDLGPPGFFSYYNLIEITIPRMVKKISPHLFENCHFLKDLKFQKNSLLKEIGEYAFSKTRIEKVELPKSTKYIRKCAFSDNFNLKQVKFYGKVIEEGAFSNTGLTEFDVPDKTTIIGSEAFKNCISLKKINVDIENSKLEEIGSYSFSNTSITEFNIPSEIISIKEGLFNGCKFLEEVKISEKSILETIEDDSFSENLSLVQINIPKTIKNISHRAFINTPSLQSIMNESNQDYLVMEDKSVYEKNRTLIFVPRNLEQIKILENCTIIHSGAFCGPYLKNVIFSDKSLLYFEDFCFAHSTGLKEITIPNSVRIIGDDAFINCQKLKKVEFESPSQIKEIPKFCFAFSGIKKINLPESVESINYSSFLLCQNLKKINLENTNVKFIGEYAFSQTGIKEIKFPSSLKYISDNIFTGCKELELIDLTNLNNFKDYEFHLYGICKSRSIQMKKIIKQISNISNKNKIKLNEFKIDFLNSDLNNNEICYIHNNAFQNCSVKIIRINLHPIKIYEFIKKCTKIEELIINQNIHFFFKKILSNDVDFNNDVNEIKLNEFNYCIQMEEFNPFIFLNISNLTKIVFSDDVLIKTIPKSCFVGSLIEEVTLSSSIQTIQKFAFMNCYQLKEVNIPRNSCLEFIEERAFYGCQKLESFKIPNKVQTISKLCFYSSGIKSIEIPSSIKKINSFSFGSCKQLETIVFNEGIEEIGEFSFVDDILLETIEFPDSLKTIKSGAFSNCFNLKEAKTSNETNLTKIYNHSFDYTQIEEFNINPRATILFDPIKVSKLNKITFSEQKPIYFIQSENGTIYEKTDKFDHFLNTYLDISNDDILLNQLLIDFIHSSEKCSRFFDAKSLNSLCNSKIKCDQIALEKVIHQNQLSKIYKNDDMSFLLKLVFAPKNLEILEINENCIQFNNGVLNDMKKLKEIEYSKGITSFALNFPNYLNFLSKINKIRILGKYSVLNSKVFSNFQSLEFVEFDESTNISFIPKSAFLECAKLKKIIIPSSCLSIEENAFKNCVALKSIEFGSNENSSKLRFIKKEAFYNCSSLESIIIPPTVFAICKRAFMNCKKLNKFEFKFKNLNEPISNDQYWLEIIERQAFKNCSSLLSFTLPPSCSTVRLEAFMNCSKLNEFVYEGSELQSIEEKVFFNCCSLKKFELLHLQNLNRKLFLNDSLKNEMNSFSIGYQAFMNCTSLVEVVIENHSIDHGENISPLTKDNTRTHKTSSRIKKCAFYNCKCLEKARIFLQNLEYIEQKAFYNCISLQKIKLNTNNWKASNINDYCDLDAFEETPDDFVIKLVQDENISIDCKQLKLKKIKAKKQE